MPRTHIIRVSEIAYERAKSFIAYLGMKAIMLVNLIMQSILLWCAKMILSCLEKVSGQCIHSNGDNFVRLLKGML